MKILALTVDVPSKDNKGYQILSYHRIKHLAKEGHEIVLITFGDKNSNLFKSACQEIERYNVKIIAIKYIKFLLPFKLIYSIFNRKLPFQCAIYKSLRYKFVANRVLKNFKPDLIYGIMLRPMGNILIKDNKFIFDIVDSLVVNFERRLKNANSFQKFFLKNELFRLRFFEEKLISKANFTIFVSGIDSKKYLNKYSNNLKIIPLGIEKKLQQNNSYSQKKYSIIFSGNMNYTPNIEAVIWFYEIVGKLLLKNYLIPNLLLRVEIHH